MADIKSSSGNYDKLLDNLWVQFPDTPYMAKYILNEDGYIILITNLKDIFGEKLTSSEVLERFSNLNPHAEMKSAIIIKHLKEILKAFELKKMTDSSRVEKCIFDLQVITMELQFTVSNVPFKFEIKAQKLPSEELRTHVVAPTVYLSIKTAHGVKDDVVQDKTSNTGKKVNEIELAKAFVKMQNCATRIVMESRAIEERIEKKLQEKKTLINVPNVKENVAVPTKRDSGGNIKDDISSSTKDDTSTKSESDLKKDVEKDMASNSENDTTSKVENNPIIKTENSVVNAMQSKQKKKKVFTI